MVDSVPVRPLVPEGGPRDSVEAELCEVWRAALTVPEVGIDDNVFDLGGDSLLAVRILDEIERLFGVELELEEFLSAATVVATAERIRSASRTPQKSIVVRLQAGTRRPVYVFHALSGTAVSYLPFVRGLPGHEVWGLQAAALDPELQPLNTVEEMADQYLSHMLPVHQGGPWHLFGYSMGGYLAVETARRLKQIGEEVGMVGLVDASAPGGARFNQPEEIRFHAVRTVARHVLRLDIDLDWLGTLAPEDQVRALLQQGIERGSLPKDYGGDRVRRMLEVRVQNRLAVAAYQPAPYAGRLVLFRSGNAADETAQPGDLEERSLGWSALASDVVVHSFGGDHRSIIAPPEIERVAAVAQNYLV